MLLPDVKKTEIFKILAQEDIEKFFTFKDKKVIPYIDTFYYSVTCIHNTSCNSDFQPFIDLVSELNKYTLADNEAEFLPFNCFSFTNRPLFYTNMRFRDFNKNLHCPDCFDIFINTDTRSSDSPFVFVQLRSSYLWLEGVENALIESKKCVLDLLHLFEFKDSDLIFKVNRIDYCFHTNYIRNPGNYFNIDHLSSIAVSRLREVNQHHRLVGYSDFETDFTAFGKRDGSIYLRMYLKTKEVVECGYKNKKCFFISMWQQHNLISYYDAWVLTRCYIKSKWNNYVDIARLEFFKEFCPESDYCSIIDNLIKASVPDYTLIHELANKLTPKLTNIVNIEFQTSRSFFRSIDFFHLDDCPLLNIFKHTYVIAEYLTTKTFRLVNYNPDTCKPENKCKCVSNSLWSLIQNAKFKDNVIPDLKLTRVYSSNTNLQMVKNRAFSSINTLSISYKGDNNDSLYDDIALLCTVANDNDVAEQLYKKRRKLCSVSSLDTSLDLPDISVNIDFIDNTSGEVILKK